MAVKLTQSQFIEKSKLIHGDKYDYSLAEYKNSRTPVSIICQIHGIFNQKAMLHMNGSGCIKCGYKSMSSKLKLSLEDFIKKSRLIHGDKYDYSRIIYKTSMQKVEIVCKIHGSFWQAPNTHLSNHGCEKCGRLSSRIKNKDTVDSFIEKAKLIHGDRYDYSLVEYKNHNTKVQIVCKIHGDWWQKPEVHLNGFNCPRCGHENSSKKQLMSQFVFIEKAKSIHGDKYDYSLSKYKGNKIKLIIICKIHGEFLQLPNKHLSGCGCTKCGIETVSNLKYKDLTYFIEKSTEVHGCKYDYSKSIYISAKTKLSIICKKHNYVFLQTPNSHIRGAGCPICKSSKGESIIRNYLIKNQIKFEEQKKFLTCKNINPLLFDFYMNELKAVIEYQGKQHYEPIKRRNSWTDEYCEQEFTKIQKNDRIKKEWCVANGIKLIEISYKDNCEKKLEQEISCSN